MRSADKLGDTSSRSPKAARANIKRGAELTAREREIAALVGKGLTNRSIANELVISERTAEFHVEQIMNKRGFHSRTQIAAWVAQHWLEGAAAEHEAESTTVIEGSTPQHVHTRWRVAVAIVVASLSLVLVVALASWRPGSATSIQTVVGTGVRAASNDVGTASSINLTFVTAITTDAMDNLYFVDGHQIRELTSKGTVTTIAGVLDPGYSGDGGPAIAARLNAPQGLAIASDGSLFVADTLNNRVRRVDQQGMIWTVAGSSLAGYSGDGGPATLAQLNLPVGLALGFGRDLYVADSGNHRVRRISSDGIISTVAGTGELGYAGDAGPATSSPVGWPTGLAFDHKGNLYIADASNDRVRKVDLNGTITTMAGTGIRGYSGDGTRASSAQLNLAPGPPQGAGQGLGVDAEGNVYIADTANHRVRRVSVAGLITTVAGTGYAGYTGDGGSASSAEINGPLALAVTADGGLYIADTENNRIREVAETSR